MRISDWSSDVCSSDLDAKGLIESYRIEKQNGASTSSARTDLANGSTPQPFALNLSKGRPSYSPALSGADHARAFLGVQTGCSHSCTFCAPVLARGTARSATIEAVLRSEDTSELKSLKS